MGWAEPVQTNLAERSAELLLVLNVAVGVHEQNVVAAKGLRALHSLRRRESAIMISRSCTRACRAAYPLKERREAARARQLLLA
jgi:hypothetical protein